MRDFKIGDTVVYVGNTIGKHFNINNIGIESIISEIFGSFVIGQGFIDNGITPHRKNNV